jgi:hypothetical protein
MFQFFSLKKQLNFVSVSAHKPPDPVDTCPLNGGYLVSKHYL